MIHFKLTERQQVLVDESIDGPVSESRIDNLAALITIRIQDEQGTSKGHQENWEDEEERKNVLDRDDDQLDVEGGGIKHSHPVKHLTPNQTDDDRTHDPSSSS